MSKKEESPKERIEREAREKTLEFEKAFLGGLLLYNTGELPKLTVQPFYFLSKHNALIFQTYLKQLKNGVEPNIQTISYDPDIRAQENDVPISYIASLTNTVPSGATMPYYETEIIKAWKIRTAKAAAVRFTADVEAAAITGEIDPAIIECAGILSGALCDSFGKKVHAVSYEEYRQRRKDRKYWEEFTPALFNRLPFPDGSINLIGARSGAGKTNALINIMRELLNTAAPDTVTNNKHREQARNAARRMIFVSREMSTDDIFDRLTLSLAWSMKDRFPCLETLQENQFFNLQKFHTSGKYPDTRPEETYSAYSYVLENIINPATKSGRLVMIDAIEAETLEEILMNLPKQNIGPGDVVLIDYIQLLPAATNKEAERYATADHLRMRYIVQELRKAAKKSEAVFICAAQLNREAAKYQSEGKTNIETAFKDSADLEQAAHSAVIINRQDGKGDKPPELSYHVVKARSSYHLGEHWGLNWKRGFYHLSIGEQIKKNGKSETGKQKTASESNTNSGASDNNKPVKKIGGVNIQ